MGVVLLLVCTGVGVSGVARWLLSLARWFGARVRIMTATTNNSIHEGLALPSQLAARIKAIAQPLLPHTLLCVKPCAGGEPSGESQSSYLALNGTRRLKWEAAIVRWAALPIFYEPQRPILCSSPFAHSFYERVYQSCKTLKSPILPSQHSIRLRT